MKEFKICPNKNQNIPKPGGGLLEPLAAKRGNEKLQLLVRHGAAKVCDVGEAGGIYVFTGIFSVFKRTD